MAVFLNNTVVCALDDGSGVKYVTNTGRIAGITDRVSLAPDAKPIEDCPETVHFDRVGIERQNGRDVNGRDR